MAYYRFTRLQQYINGQPTDTYAKGERVDDVDYSTYETCMGSSGNSRWVSIPQTVCYNGDLWSMEKEQISYDAISWADTGNTRRAAVIEPSASQCSGAGNDWRVVYGEYICNGTTKCLKEAEYIDNSPTGRTRAGSIVELLSEDCGVMYQWVNVPNEYLCVYKCGRADKYTKQKQQYSIDGGLHWEDTGETREGDFVEKNSSYCGCDTLVTRWVTVSGEYVCVGTSKYTKEKEQTSTDGTNWTDTGNTRAGSLIETSSSSCASTRWVTASGQYSCVGTDKYNLEKEQSSTDGEHWTDTGNTRAGSTLIEQNSTDCGYVPPSITRWVEVSGEYVCSGTSKYNKEKEEISYDGGTTWSDTGNTRAGSFIEPESYDCGRVDYRWVTVSGQYSCVGYDKYNLEKEQQSTDGINWTDTGSTRAGSTLIEQNSEDCGYVPPSITRWVADTGYMCVGTSKYNKEKEQISYDSGSTWSDTGNTRAGSTLIEADSSDCGYTPPPITRWVADTGYMCVGTDKYNKEKEQQSTDGGEHWTDTGSTRAGSTLIEQDSEDCQGALLEYKHAYYSLGNDVLLPYKAWVENGTELYIKVTTDEDVQRQCFPGSTSDNPEYIGNPSSWGGLTFSGGTSYYGTFTFVGSQKDDTEKSITIHYTFTPDDFYKSCFIVVTSSTSGSTIPSFDDYHQANFITTVTGPVVKRYLPDEPYVTYIKGSLTVNFYLTIFYKS